MTIDAQIAALLAEAEPLRCLDDDDPAKESLNGIVTRVNALRDQQANGWRREMPAPDIDPQAPDLSLLPPVLPVRRPGRPKKAA